MSWLDDEQRRERWMVCMRSLNPDSHPGSTRLMENLFIVSRLIQQMGEAGLNEAGTSLAQYRILLHLFFAENVDEQGELNPSEISKRQGVSRNTISSLIRNLETEGLIDRRLDAHDKRKFNISLTENGRSLIRQYASQHLSHISQAFAGLTQPEQDTLTQLLSKISIHIMALRQNN